MQAQPNVNAEVKTGRDQPKTYRTIKSEKMLRKTNESRDKNE